MGKQVRAFETDRSQQDSNASHEHARAAANAVILINGGAATAILAFLSRESVLGKVIDVAAVSLGLYTVGVCFGALTYFAIATNADHWSYYWQCVSKDYGDEEMSKAERLATRWQNLATAFFCGGLGSFMLASLTFAVAIFRLR